MKRSLLVLLVGAVSLFTVEWLANRNASAFINVPWALSLACLGVVLAILGAAAYHFMVGNVFMKFVLIGLIVVIANGATEIAIGSDQAYPWLTLWLIIPYAIACWIGATLALIIARVRRVDSR